MRRPMSHETRLTERRRCAPPPLPTTSRDSDLWSIYTRTCLGQALRISAKAALNEDPDVEATAPEHVQPARRAPGKR